jgi:hypothetical protein
MRLRPAAAKRQRIGQLKIGLNLLLDLETANFQWQQLMEAAHGKR